MLRFTENKKLYALKLCKYVHGKFDIKRTAKLSGMFRPFNVAEDILPILATQIAKITDDISFMAEWGLDDWYSFFKRVSRVIRNRKFMSGTPVALLYVLPYTAKHVQSSLDKKKKMENQRLDVRGSVNDSLDVSIDTQNMGYRILYRIKSKEGIRDEVVRELNSTTSFHMSLETVHDGAVFLKKNTNNLTTLLIFLLQNQICISKVYVTNSRSLYENIFNLYINSSTIDDKSEIPAGNSCSTGSRGQFVENRLLPKVQSSSFPVQPFNRNGVGNDIFRSPIAKMCFEAAKKNAQIAANDEKVWQTDCLSSRLFFGKTIPSGTGHDFFVEDDM